MHAASQVQVYQFITDSTRSEDAKVSEEKGDEAGRGVINPRRRQTASLGKN